MVNIPAVFVTEKVTELSNYASANKPIVSRRLYSRSSYAAYTVGTHSIRVHINAYDYSQPAAM